MIKRNLKLFFLIPALAFTISAPAATYTGGNGDGSATLSSTRQTLNGSSNASAKFQGTIGDGAAQTETLWEVLSSISNWLNYESTANP